MSYVFGPVPSRRLGRSLGIDTIPLKTCNWNCVYCQLGRSQPLVNERKEYFPREAILAEIKAALKQHAAGTIDWITFVGSGEPTLHSSIGWLIQQVKHLTSLPIAVITNGSLLYLPEVQTALLGADAVLPTLDAGNPQLYKLINRPHPELDYERFVNSLREFRVVYKGKLWIEVMLVRGLNDTAEALEELAQTLQSIGPDQVHILLPDRPPAETWVQPPEEEGLMRAAAILGNIAHVVPPVEGDFDLSGTDNIVDAIIAIITRHPMRQDQLENTLRRWAPGQIQETLKQLESSGRAQKIIRYDTVFWSATPAHYPQSRQSQHTRPNL
ncbi:MAG: radical SAM protein [Chloroflexi bacterium]|nr:radical SAM protein [Chloroflexota bacterium]